MLDAFRFVCFKFIYAVKLISCNYLPASLHFDLYNYCLICSFSLAILDRPIWRTEASMPLFYFLLLFWCKYPDKGKYIFWLHTESINIKTKKTKLWEKIYSKLIKVMKLKFWYKNLNFEYKGVLYCMRSWKSYRFTEARIFDFQL